MPEERVKRKLSAIFSADVEGYSRLMGDDEASTVRTLESYRKVMADLIDQFRGRVVDSPGDNLLAEFGSVVDAVQCAVEIQEVLKAKNEELSEDRKMQFRIGVNLGDVIEEGDRIYGDGVNIAARIEGLAEAGGICVSGSAHEQIKTKLAFGYEYIGEHSVKNIAEPLKVYRVPMGPKDVAGKVSREKEAGPKRWRWAILGGAAVLILLIAALAIWNLYLRRPSVEAADPERMAYPLPDKPSIAVLPFDNLSGDPEQEYIADGISENIIAALSKLSRMFVIARNSTFTYKGRPVKVRQVAEELGVRYVLEGSVQRSGDRLRVTAQLIDAIDGYHLWSEKYDRKMGDFFNLQDEITKKIIISLQVELEIGETARIDATGTQNLEAWSSVSKGIQLEITIIEKNHYKALALFEAATKLDPEYVSAWNWMAMSHTQAALLGWGESRAASMKLAHEFIKKALSIDDRSPQVYMTLGRIYRTQGQLEKAITEYRRAISLNPNYSPCIALLGATMTKMGEFEEAIKMIKKAMRLSPYYPAWYLKDLGRAYIFTGKYKEAISTYNQLLNRCRKGECPPRMALIGLAWVNVELENVEVARTFITEALESDPKVSLARYQRRETFKDPAHLQRMLDALSKAGLK